MKKTLFVSHTANFSKFNRPIMRRLRKQGWRVDYVSSGEEDVHDCDNEYKIPIPRSPLSLRNVTAVLALRRLLRVMHYDLIHCHTPTGGVVARLANFLAGRECRTKIIYTAHGFHFYTGAPLSRWLMLYPIEKLLSYITDAIITINREDYRLVANKFRTAAYMINGVGVDLRRFSPVTVARKNSLRKAHGYNKEDTIVIYVADLRRDKNQIMIVRNMSRLRAVLPNLRVLFVGKNTHDDIYRAIQSTEGCEFLGYRQDVDELFKLSDIAISTSVREGLGLNLIEAAASGVPVACSDIRGHSEIVKDGVNGLLFRPTDDAAMVESVKRLVSDAEVRQRYIAAGLRVVTRFSVDAAVDCTLGIYQEVLHGK